MYEPYASMEWIEGMIGSRLVKDDKGVVTMKDPPAGMTTQEYRFSETQPDVPLARHDGAVPDAVPGADLRDEGRDDRQVLRAVLAQGVLDATR